MRIVVCYDVNTEAREGRRRLRRVAKACESRGQRVQKSVFECVLDRAEFEALERQLLDIIDVEHDSLRLYRLAEGVSDPVKQHGSFRALDFDGPLVL
jgi:CRISPR-associated protein Cas2